MEDGDVPQSEAVAELVVVAEAVGLDLEGELCLSDGGLVLAHGGVHHVVVVVDTVLVLALIFVVAFVGQGGHHVNVGPHFPQVRNLDLDVPHTVLGSDVDLGLDGVELTLGVFLEVDVSENEFLVVLVLPDGHFGMVVDLGVSVLVGPLVVLGLPPGHGLTVLLDAVVVVISKDEPVIVEASPLHDHEELGLREGLDLHGGGVVEGEFVVNLQYFLGLEVDDVDLGFGDVQDDDFLLVDHAEGVDDVVVLADVELLARPIEMDNAFLHSGLVHPHEDESTVEGGGRFQDLGPGFAKLDGIHVLEQHILKIIKE
jgi:hypothetical protein